MDIAQDQSASPKTTFLKDYTPPEFQIPKTELIIELAAQDTHVYSRLICQRNDNVSADIPLVLHGVDLELIEIKIDGDVLDKNHYEVIEEELLIKQVPDNFVLEIHNVIHPKANTALEGLYASSKMLCTQCEAEGFRRITYFSDRPDVMSEYTVTLQADKTLYPVLLSNGNPIDSGDDTGGTIDSNRHWVKWHDPSLKPSYLFAVVAGQLECMTDSFTTMSGRKIELRVYVEAENRHKCDHAMKSLQQAMKWDEETYGREYDLDIFMIVAVNDFNMGAMENKGLNIFNSSCVLASPEAATDDDFYNIQSIIGHEYFHNWSGNRVTCRDWFQLSLKEGFTVFRDQEFSADLNSRPVKRVDDVNILRISQFAQDAGPLAHPVRPDHYIEISNFYTVTVYNKGAEVVRMIKNLLGWEGFRKGTDLYFSRHDGQAVTTDDFVKAMEDANGIDLRQFKRWYSQAGTPVLNIIGDYNEKQKTYTLSVVQSCPATPGQEEKLPFHIPLSMGLLDKHGAELVLESDFVKENDSTHAVLEIKQAEQKFTFSNIESEPTPSLLREFSAPVQIVFDYSDQQLAMLLAHDSDAFNRWDAGQKLSLNTLRKLIDSKNSEIVPEYIYSAYEKILADEKLDMALTAQALTLPSESYIADQCAVVDVDAIHSAREYLKNKLASKLEPMLLQRYKSLQSTAVYEFTAQAMAQRSLKNLALNYLVSTGKPEYIELCYQQFSTATNMTDQLAAFQALVYYENVRRAQVIEEFYQQWQPDNQVVEKWFAIQASAPVADVLQQVIGLLSHEAFSMQNPNKVRSVIGRFCMGNPTAFHKADGSGYNFLKEQVILLNKLNPQIAARLLQAMIRWKRYDDNRQQLMRQAFRDILNVSDLSKDVFEIAERGLAG